MTTSLILAAVLTYGPGLHEVTDLELKSNDTLVLEEGARLVATTNTRVAAVFARNATNVTIRGKGTIDGNGAAFNRLISPSPNFRLLPRAWSTLKLIGCRDVRVEGVRLEGATGWTFPITDSDGVTVRGITMFSHANFNNDGIDISSRNVLIEDCDIDSEDDAIVFKVPKVHSVVSNAVVRNCRLSTNSSFIKFGTESRGIVRDVLVEKCDLAVRTPIRVRCDHRRTPGARGVDNGICGIEVLVVDGGTLENVTVRDITMGRGILVPIFVRGGTRKAFEGRKTFLRNVLIENVKMTAPSESLVASSVTGVAGIRPENVTLRNIDLLYRGGCERDSVDVPREGERSYPSPHAAFLSALPAYGFYVRHADGVRFENVKLRVADRAEERPAIVVEDAAVTRVGVDAFEPDAATLAQPGGYRLVDPGKTPFPMASVREYVFPERVFDITAYGAVPDGSTNTAAFAAAIAAASAAGGGRVFVPEGTWVTGPIHFRSNVELHLHCLARLVSIDDPAAYLPAVRAQWEGNECYNYSPLFYAYGCTNVAITGRGVLAPKTDFWKTWMCRPPAHLAATEKLYSWGCTNAPVEVRDLTKLPGANMRPHLLHFNRCSNVALRDIRIEDAPFWVVHTLLCDNVSVKRIGVFVPANGNRDGLDIDMTQNVIVQGCEIQSGDDVFAFKAGRNADAWRLATPTRNVVVRDILSHTGHALMALGSELSGGLENIWMHDVRHETSGRVVFLKTSRRRGGFVRNVWLEDVEVGTVRRVFELKTDYACQYNDFPDYEQRVTAIDGVHLRNVRVARAKDAAFVVHGDRDLPARNLTVENLRVDNCANWVKGEVTGVADPDVFAQMPNTCKGIVNSDHRPVPPGPK